MSAIDLYRQGKATYNERGSVRSKVEEELAAEIEYDQYPMRWRVVEKKIIESAGNDEEETAKHNKAKSLRLNWPVAMDNVDHQGTTDEGTQRDDDGGVPGIPP